jgi:hypothetical protein
MCCFTQTVEKVSGTQIFARRASKSSQFLVYSMKLAAKQDLAMILPLPVPKGAGEHAVKFIDLTKYPEFFSDLQRAFPTKDAVGGGPASKGVEGGRRAALAVVDVGSFEASFVPTVKDFDRLDARFRLPPQTWKALGRYEAFGFAVFKLKAKHQTFHPMAFEFPTTYASELFYPTVHVHDGKVHEQAAFDHMLYCQIDELHHPGFAGWEESTVPIGMVMDYTRGAPVLERFTHVLRHELTGLHPNRDVVVG